MTGTEPKLLIGDDHEHLNLNQTRSPCSGPDGQQRNHGWHGLLVQCAAPSVHGSDVAGQHYGALNERRGLSIRSFSALVDYRATCPPHWG